MTTQTHYCSGNHILVGLGGTGGKILRAFKMRMFEEFPTAEERNKLPIALLYVDSTREMMPKDGRARADFRVMGQDASFSENEFLNIKAVDVEYILNHIGNYPALKGIVQNADAVRSAIGSLGQAAGQKRRAGRLLFAANATGYVNSLANAYARCEQRSGNASNTNIYIFAGLCGGTGSGSIVDAVVQTRKRFPDAIISVFAMLPEMNLPKADMDQGRYYPNGYAAMRELNALQAGRWTPQDVTGHGPAKYYNERIHGVADGLTIYSNVNENGLRIDSLTELPKTVSDFVYARIFFVNEEDRVNEDIVRAFKYENMDDFCLEYDETANGGPSGTPVARTKKIVSFGIKRVMYPELRILKHITYTVGEGILFQFKYNNWRENQGYIDQECNKDYRKLYFNKENLAHWMLDEKHLTLEEKILPSDTDYPKFDEYWHDKAIAYADEAKKADCPLNELDNIMGEFFDSHFREDGAEAFFQGKERILPEMAKEVRHVIEHELYEKWKLGDISIVELQKVSRLLIERIGEIREELETALKEEKENYAACDDDRKMNVEEWSRLGILQRMVGIGARRYADHQNILSDYYTSKTRLLALNLASKLAAAISVQVGKMDADISAFGQKITDAIEETEKLITAQHKVNKGLEDMRGAIIEVSEDETMAQFEVDLKTEKVDMPEMARQIRESILPTTEFVNFGLLANDISVDDIKDAFDIKLSQIVKTKHDEKADSDQKVLGLNILTQLQQKLKTDDDIKAFAHKIISQSGMYLKLNNDQVQLHLRNNEGHLSPSNPASINKKAILISIPAPEDNVGLKKFTDKLEAAFKETISLGTAQTNITVNRKSPRKDELCIITVGYCFPMRCSDWMGTYKERYENFLHMGNSATDNTNAILLHSEGTGEGLPTLFAVENAEEIAQQKAAMAAANTNAAQQQASAAYAAASSPMATAPTPPPMPTPPPAPGMPVPPPVPQIQVMLSVNGTQYGPFNYDQCKQMVTGNQMNAQTLVWMAGMPAWAQASQVPELAPLFAPAMPQMPPVPQMPPMPPAGAPVPPPVL